MSRSSAVLEAGRLRWRLQVLEILRVHELERARVSLSVAQQAAAAADAKAAAWEQHRSVSLAELQAHDGKSLDIGEHSRALRYLAHVGRHIQLAQEEAAAAAARKRVAAEACLATDRRLECVLELRHLEDKVRAGARSRRAGVEADADWLARTPPAQAAGEDVEMES